LSQVDSKLKNVLIYTDGACSGNPGPGGWAAVLLYGPHRKEISGAAAQTTNQRMELQAALEALSCLREPCQAQVYSDSAYLINGFNQHWLQNWQKNNWQTSKKTPVENQDLWKGLWQLQQKHKVTWHKLPGHSGIPENERCDQLAKAALRNQKTEVENL
jgi:ribonuclease HI